MFRFLTFLLLFLNLAPVKAQDFPVRAFSIQNGLIHNHVTALYQDKRNYLWVGTHAGISRFNGEDFINYHKKDGLPSNHFLQMTEDKSGDIWILSPQGISCFDGVSWYVFNSKNPVEFGPDAAIGMNNFDAPYISDKGTLYEITDNYLTQSHRFSHLDLKDSIVKYYYHKPQNIWLIAKRNILTGYNSANLQKSFIHEFQTESTIELLSSAEHLIIKESRKSADKYYALASHNLELLSEVQSGFDPVVINPFPHKYCIVSQHGIFRYYPAGNQFVRMKSRGQNSQQQELIVSSNQNLFYSEGEGFYQILCESFTSFPQVKNTWMLALGSDDTLFAGGYFPSKLFKIKGAVVKEVDLTDMYDQINSITHKPKSQYSFYPGGSFLQDNTGYFPFSAGVLQYKDGKATPILQPGFESVFFTCADTSRNRVVCGISGGIMIIQDGKVVEKIGTKSGIHPNKYITSIAIDFKHRYWLGSTEGLSCFDPDSGKVVRNYTIGQFSDALRGGVISLTCDYSGRLWIGTARGLCYLNDDQSDLILVSDDQMLIYCSSLAETRDHHLLIGSPEGLLKFDYRTFLRTGKIKFKLYNQASGYLKEDTVTAILRDSSGSVWMGCLDQLIKHDPQPDSFTVRNLLPSIQSINGVKISNLTGKHAPFKIQDNHLSIVYEAVGFSRPSTTQYTYRLKGMEEDWRPWTSFQYAIFENLNNGKYEFQVRARSLNAGFDDLPVASIPIYVQASFVNWPTFPYYIAAMITLFLLGIMILILKFKQTADKQIQLEKEAKFLRVQALQSQMNPHFVFNVLASVQNLVMKNDTRLAARYLADFGTMIRQFLNASVTGNSYNEYDKNQTIPLQDEINLINTFVHLEQFNYPDRFEYVLEIAEDVHIENYSIPPMIVQPFVENAIKYGLLYSGSRNRLLRLSIRSISESGFEITILDNGVGRAKAREYQQNSIRSHKSLGSDLVFERIRILNQMGNQIELDISDNPEGGTLVTISVYELQ